MFTAMYGREKRNTNSIFNPMLNPVLNYCTETLHKSDMRQDYDDNFFLNNLHLIPDPLKKNLADHLPSEMPEKTRKKTSLETQIPAQVPEKPPITHQEEHSSRIAGITNFFTGVFNMLSSAMFRPRSPVHYYDCFDSDAQQGSPPTWQAAKTNDQDKNGTGAVSTTPDGQYFINEPPEMNSHCRTAASKCENKLNQVKGLLTSKPQSSPIWLRKRPRKVFVEPNSVEENFEDAFSPEDFVCMPNNSYMEYYSPYQYHCEEFCESDAPKIKVEYRPMTDNVSIVQEIDNNGLCDDNNDQRVKEKSLVCDNELNLECDKVESNLETKMIDDLKMEHSKTDDSRILEPVLEVTLKPEVINLNLESKKMNEEQQPIDNLNKESVDEVDSIIKMEPTNLELEPSNLKLESLTLEPKPLNLDPVKTEIISSCEDKLAKLKALLQEKRNKSRSRIEPETIVQEPEPPIVKPKDKHYKNPHRSTDKRMKSKIKQKIEEEMCFANEIDVDVPVQGSPNIPPCVTLADYFDEVTGRFQAADNDDSFQIVFTDCAKRVRLSSDCDSEDSFIVFEDSPDSCYTSNDVFGESDESDTDSEVSDSGCSTLTCKLSGSMSRTVSNLTDDSLFAESGDEVGAVVEPKVEGLKTGLLVDEEKRRSRRDCPVKRVHFSTQPPKVHLMRVWSYAARQARAGHWERFALDRERFRRRIADTDMAVSWVLKPQHRSRVMFQRFMPWWNAERRRELAEKKERERLGKIAEETRQKEAEVARESEEERVREDIDEGEKTGEKIQEKDKMIKVEEENLKKVEEELNVLKIKEESKKLDKEKNIEEDSIKDVNNEIDNKIDHCVKE